MSAPLERDELRSEERRFATSDGVGLSYTVWARDAESSRTRIIAILPGIGFHSLPYEVVGSSLPIPGTMFAALDYRGHGRSEGVRGELRTPERMTLDVEEWLSELKVLAPSAHLFLLGESMGGPWAILTALRRRHKLAGLVLVAPAVIPSWRLMVRPDSIRVLADLAMRPFSATVDLTGWRLDTGSRDQEFISLRRKDALALDKVSPVYMLRIAQGMLQMMLRRHAAVECPVFVAHGGADHVVSPLGSRVLLLRLSCPEKRLLVLPKAYHTLFWDPCAAVLFNELTHWILQHSPQNES